MIGGAPARCRMRFSLVSVACRPRYAGMTSSKFLARACVIALAFGLASPTIAQTSPSYGTAVVQPISPATTLSENLKALARDPYNVDALLQAGSGALQVGDPNAAFGFFARAEELSPSNFRAKIGLGSALTQMEKPKDALRAFEEAIALGASERDILADRGLAYDLTGDVRRAQKDYIAALKAVGSDEVTRRLALSLGISGDKEAALSRLDPLLRRNDQAAWRARAFVLAMNGDNSGAEKIVRMVAPSGTAASMVSFMQRLSDLGPSARAHAVHFGTLPSSGSSLASVADADGFRPVDSASAARLAAPPPDRTEVVSTRTLSPKEARRKAREDERLAKLAERGRKASDKTEPSQVQPAPKDPVVSARVAAALPAPGDKVVVLKGARELPLPDAITSRANDSGRSAVAAVPKAAEPTLQPPAPQQPSPIFEVPPRAPVLTQPAVPPVAAEKPASPVSVAVSSDPVRTDMPSSSPQTPAAEPVAGATVVPAPPASAAISPVALPPSQVAAQPGSAPSSSSATSGQLAVATIEGPRPSAPATADIRTPVVQAPAAKPPLTLAEIVNTLELEQESAAAPLPDEAQLRAARLAAQKRAAAEEKLKAEKLAEEKRIAEEEANARRNPARIWVQIATGNNRSGLPGTWRKLKEQASKSLAKQSAWTVPFRQTNRLLVGPLKSTSEARQLVNSLANEGVQATTFSSEAGQEISRIGGR